MKKNIGYFRFFYNTEAKKSVFEVLDAKYIEKKTSWLVEGLVDLKNVELV